jgi:hypothetical protein
MSTIKIKSANQLAQFLKVLAEESINVAQVDIDAERKHQRSTANAARRDLGRFMKEDDADPNAAAPAATPPAAPPTDLAMEPSPDTAAPPAKTEKPAAATPSEQGPLEPSFDAVTRAILDLRSGKSVKDSAIETELEAYYDRLQDPERYAMIIFLRSLSGILTGKMTGAQATDPSDAPHGITITRDATPGSESAPPPAPEAAPSDLAAPAPEAGETPPAPEETTPAPAGPIQIGSPVTEAFRERIRQLIRANV